MPMNYALKNRWIACLRGGSYEQGADLLRENVDDGPDTLCCLGVLCEIANMPRRLREGATSYEYLTDGKWAYALPNEGEDENGNWQSVDTSKDFLGISELQMGKLTGMNDSGKPFTEIADWIEENI